MNLSEQKQNNVLILSLSGNLCTEEIRSIKEHLIPYTKDSELKGIIFDMLEVNIIDSAGLALIVQLYKVFKAEEKRIVLSSLSGKNRDLFLTTKLDRVVSIMDNTEEAMKAFITN